MHVMGINAVLTWRRVYFRTCLKFGISSAWHYSASKIALYAILRVMQAPKCDFGAFCVHQTWQWSRRLNCYVIFLFPAYILVQAGSEFCYLSINIVQQSSQASSFNPLTVRDLLRKLEVRIALCKSLRDLLYEICFANSKFECNCVSLFETYCTRFASQTRN